MVRICYFACLLLCLYGCYDRVDTPPFTDSSVSAPTMSIRDLAASCADTATPVGQEIIICGRVTTSDESGNFYRSFFIQDGEAGVELLGGLWDLYHPYPLGRLVAVKLRGLAVGKRFGVVQIGRMPATGNYAVDYIGSRALLDAHVERGTVATVPEPLSVQISDLSPERCGTLVRIGPVTLAEEETERTWNGYRTFVDLQERSIVVYTSSYARFADAEVPAGPVTLTGILQYGKTGSAGETFMLKMRDETDCVADE
ncbi:MAG TPA: hypothetical protein H9779_07480 [Candidatus Alistipes avicola]|uniref:DUF5689 domain-containing protein n=1 Tax=Candidatus Alistipes avicola TaxID=2838432 RepID=A0A9D2L4Z9_9BACT|nr:DUF5689 domain-containing protein [uncultured Alistipes sp.]HJA99419.1 hypothetical protein [Candidatus Alistipes avicola]